MKFSKRLLFIFTFCFILLSLSASAFAADGEETGKLIGNPKGRVVAVSHRGDTAFYPANTLEAVISAEENGADAVSLAVNSTKDGVFVLSEDIPLSNICDTEYELLSEITYEELIRCPLYASTGEKTEYHIISLSDALKELDGSVYLILDIDWNDRDAVFEILNKADALSYVSLRADVSSKDAAKWSEGKIDVISIYDGNIIWSSISHINNASSGKMTMAEYRTKNYFNVCYGTIVGDNFSAEDKARALAACYDTNLCGKRSDSAEGWDELIKDGFTVIETNNIEGLSAYIREAENMKSSLKQLAAKVNKADTDKYSAVSRENIEYALENADSILGGRAVSLSELQKAYSSLVFSLNEKRAAESAEETEGALNITAGKVIAVVIIGAVLLAAQVFVYKKHKKKKA